MQKSVLTFFASIALIFVVACGETPKKEAQQKEAANEVKRDSSMPKQPIAKKEKPKEAFVLNEENAIDFFFKYADTLTKDKVRLTTDLGSFTVQLFDNVPYHRANFIFLARKGYFNDTQFHRVVKNFIIQGGNSDDRKTSKKRAKIGRYLLPPDGKKGHKHHRGTISMPSSERDNPHKLASPYEFFIVVTRPGSYHLDGNYTPFGKVVQGMDVVDAINNVSVGDGDWPDQNIWIEKVEVLD